MCRGRGCGRGCGRADHELCICSIRIMECPSTAAASSSPSHRVRLQSLQRSTRLMPSLIRIHEIFRLLGPSSLKTVPLRRLYVVPVHIPGKRNPEASTCLQHWLLLDSFMMPAHQLRSVVELHVICAPSNVEKRLSQGLLGVSISSPWRVTHLSLEGCTDILARPRDRGPC